MVKYYDHAKNSYHVSDGVAMAKARRLAIKTGQAYRVEANWPGQERFYWEGCRFDVLGLAKDLRRNNAENVIMTNPSGELSDISQHY